MPSPEQAARELNEIYRAERDELLRFLQMIANTDKHERDGQDITAETMRKVARAAIAKARGK